VSEDDKACAWNQLSNEERRAYNRGRMQKLTRNRDAAPRPSRDTMSTMQHVLAPLKKVLPTEVARLITDPPPLVHAGPGFQNFERAHPVIATWWNTSKDRLAASLREACMQYGGTLTPKQLAFAYKLAKNAPKVKTPSRLKRRAAAVERSSGEAK